MFGNRIKQLLLSSGKSVADLATFCEVTHQGAYRWLNDETMPRGKTKAMIAKFFGVSLQALEYGPILSLSSGKDFKLGELSPDIAESTVSLMIDAELQNGPARSAEYRLGMRNELLRCLSNLKPLAPYSSGTCQLDAYLSGVDHARAIIDRIRPDQA